MKSEACPNCGSTEKTPDGRCATCGQGPDYSGAVMSQIYVITGSIFVSILIYAALAVALTQGPMKQSSTVPSEWLPGALVGFGAVMMVASVFVSMGVLRMQGPRAVVRGVIVAAALAEVPAICGLVSTLLTSKLVWMAWGIGFALVAFLALAFEMPAIAQRIQEWQKQLRDGR